MLSIIWRHILAVDLLILSLQQFLSLEESVINWGEGGTIAMSETERDRLYKNSDRWLRLAASELFSSK